LEHAFPGLHWWAWAFLLVTLLMLINLGSVDLFGRFQIGCVIIMLSSQLVFPLLAFAGRGLEPVHYSAFSPFLRTEPMHLLSLVIIAYFLFAVFQIAFPLGDSQWNPAKNLPRSIIGSDS